MFVFVSDVSTDSDSENNMKSSGWLFMVSKSKAIASARKNRDFFQVGVFFIVISSRTAEHYTLNKKTNDKDRNKAGNGEEKAE